MRLAIELDIVFEIKVAMDRHMVRCRPKGRDKVGYGVRNGVRH